MRAVQCKQKIGDGTWPRKYGSGSSCKRNQDFLGPISWIKPFTRSAENNSGTCRPYQVEPGSCDHLRCNGFDIIPEHAVGFVARVASAMAPRVSLRRNSPSYSDERKPSEAIAAAAIASRSRNPTAYSRIIVRHTSWNKILTCTIFKPQALCPTPVDTLTSERLRRYMLHCTHVLKLSEATLHSRLNAIKFYVEKVLHLEKFFVDIPRPKKPRTLPKHLSQHDVKRLFDQTTNLKHNTMLRLCYGMGLRLSELVGLKVQHIDGGNMQVHICRAKGKKDRYVPLPTSILEQLRAYFRTYRPKEYLFEGQYGGAYTTRSAQAVFKQAMHKAGINKDIGIHGLRHSYATHLLEAGTDIGFIQKLLGHEDIKTTLLYAQVTNRNLKQIKSPLDSL